MRVNISIDAYYNGHFRDEGKWVCCGMQSPDQTELMFCYTPRGHSVAAQGAGRAARHAGRCG